ncbi:hypothetical protein E2C01_011753 [Portunus trituberculatus]|uniref:Uncharacterized protein n=1 Tax=Portunus trituberculatus TaxID=210409 RepID=A0A5B7DCB7_PORTR|nr:hypothetical protein [Portunus trituberculatus]
MHIIVNSASSGITLIAFERELHWRGCGVVGDAAEATEIKAPDRLPIASHYRSTCLTVHLGNYRYPSPCSLHLSLLHFLPHRPALVPVTPRFTSCVSRLNARAATPEAAHARCSVRHATIQKSFAHPLSPRLFSKAAETLSHVSKTVFSFNNADISSICHRNHENTFKNACSFN